MNRPPSIRTLTRFVTMLLIAFVCAAPRAARAADIPAGDGAIMPYLDEGTFVVARLDIDRVDREAFVTYMQETIEAMFEKLPVPAELKPQIMAQATEGINKASTWLGDMSEAGGKQVYVLFDKADFTGDEPSPAMIVPLVENADADTITGLLQKGLPEEVKIERIGNAIVFGNAPVAERLKGRVAGGPLKDSHPHLTDAMAAGGESPLRFALLPTDSTRTWMQENLPMLPQEIGGGDTKTLSRGLNWATLNISQKPKTTGSLTLRAVDAANAQALLAMVSNSIAFLKKTAANGADAQETAAQLDAAAPKLEGETLTLEFDPAVLRNIAIGMNAHAQAEVEVDSGDADVKTEVKEKDGL